ncbi:MAG: protein kinase [Candidatus Methylacidiphilales bacterium]|nr:protein kinase [Candidatus Methylacidiphilales bacterium]
MKRSEKLWTEDQFLDPAPGGFAELSPGDTIGKFRIIRELGKGGMGAVYLAVNPVLQTEVALKILPPSVVRDSPQVAQRFLREARLAAQINHKRVVAVKDADLDSATGLYYMVLEYVPGGSLGDRLASGPFAEEDALCVVFDVAQALEEAEAHHIVHRDIKPDNIMLDAQGHAKLADLGVAKQVIAKATNLTQEGSSIGTPAYMSPDQIRNAQDADTRDDIYSLGATLYELLTGQPPFDGSTAYNIVSKVLSSPTPNPRDINPDISPSVAALCMKMMARSKAARHQNAAALIDDLQRLSDNGLGPVGDPHQMETLTGEGNMMVPPSLEQIARRHANRYNESEFDQDSDERSGTSRAITWVLSALLVVALFVGAAMMLRDKPQPVVPVDPGKLPRVVDTTKPTNGIKPVAHGHNATNSPNNSNPGDIRIAPNSETPEDKNPKLKRPRLVKDKDENIPKALPVDRDPNPTYRQPSVPTPGPQPFTDVKPTAIDPHSVNPSGTISPFDRTPEIPPLPEPSNFTVIDPKTPEAPLQQPSVTNRVVGTPPIPEPPAVPDDKVLPSPPVVDTHLAEIAVPDISEVVSNGMPILVPPTPVVPPSDPDVVKPTLHPPGMSAFEARRIAGARLKRSISSKLLKVEGVQPTGINVTPTEWRFWFYDPEANECYRRVIVINGVAGAPADGIYMNPLAFKADDVLPNDLLKTDSERALEIIMAQEKMDGVKLTSTSFKLDNKDTAPVWRVKLFGYTAKKGKIRSLGEAMIFVETGKVRRLDVKLD